MDLHYNLPFRLWVDISQMNPFIYTQVLVLKYNFSNNLCLLLGFSLIASFNKCGGEQLITGRPDQYECKRLLRTKKIYKKSGRY